MASLHQFRHLYKIFQVKPRVNSSSASEHVMEIERLIRLAKETIRSIIHSLPFNNVPTIFLIHFVFQAIKMPNHFPL